MSVNLGSDGRWVRHFAAVWVLLDEARDVPGLLAQMGRRVHKECAEKRDSRFGGSSRSTTWRGFSPALPWLVASSRTWRAFTRAP